jgi:hypothetical protein
MGITIWDTVSAQHFSIDYTQVPLPEDFDLGLRDTVYRIEYRWIGDQELLIKPYFDYQSTPAHPGHDDAWHAKLGDLAGHSDPLETDRYLVELDEEPAVNWKNLPEDFSWFVKLR